MSSSSPTDQPQRELGSRYSAMPSPPPAVPTMITMTMRSRPSIPTPPLSRWTDSDLLCVLNHSDGNVMIATETAIETVLRHEATGQPPENLIHHMSMGAVVGDDTSGGAGQRPSLSEISPSALRSNQGSVSATMVSPSRTMPDVRQGGHGHTATSHAYEVSPSLVHGALSRFLALDINKNLTPIEKRAIQLGIFSRMEQGQPSAAVAVPKSKTRKQKKGRPPLPPREMDMLSAQAGIEASLKEARNSYLDDEALSYAVQASKKSFEEESKQVELLNAQEANIINMALAESLSYPVQKSEEELIAKAMIESLADPVKKSEDQLIQEAMANSLKDPIRNFEEELVEEVMRLSLLPTMSCKEEELFEAAKHQSLISFAETERGGKMPAQASMPNNRRISTENASSSWCLPEDILDNIDDKKRPSTPKPDFLSEAEASRKMPALVQNETQTHDGDVAESSSIVAAIAKKDRNH